MNTQFKIVRRDQSALPTPSELRTQLLEEGLFPYEWSNPPGDTYAPHIHDYDKVIVVVRGSITWALGVLEMNQAIETRVGDRVELPRGTWHAAEAGPEGVVYLEGHIL